MKLRKSRYCLAHRSVFLLGRNDELSVYYVEPSISPIEFTNRKRMMLEQWKICFRCYNKLYWGYRIIGVPNEV